VARWQPSAGGLQAVAGGAVRGVHLSDWRADARGDRVVVGQASAARLPVGDGPVRARPIEERTVTLQEGDQLSLPKTGCRLDLPGAPDVVVGVDGPGTVRRTEEAVHLELAGLTRLRLALAGGPRPTVTVPDSARGLAAAVTAAGSTHLVSGPGRSHPSLRDVPPRMEAGTCVDLPEWVAQTTPDGAGTVLVPDEPEVVLGLAPLAYYLGAGMEVADVSRPSIELAEGERLTLDPSGSTPRCLLERTFWLDCLLRAHAGEAPIPAEVDLLESLSVDPGALAGAAPIERLAAARDLPSEAAGQSLPDWHLATYVHAGEGAVQALPYVFDRLAHVYTPTSEPLEPETFMERSLDDFYRASRPTPTVDLVEPSLGRGRLHGWLAPETPVEAFKLLDGGRVTEPPIVERPEPLSVTLVLNDPEMVDEQTDVAAAYRRGAPIDLSVTTHEELSRDALSAVLESETDLLHFIGHCEPDGLVCRDGTLTAETISRAGPRVVFLNACGSYHEGAALVRRGATAAIVTYRGVLDSQAATVGAAFARVATRGFSLERATRLARRQVMMGMDYGVVGDGTHRLTRGLDPVLLDIEPEGEDRYRVRCETFAEGQVGATTRVPLAGDDRGRLRGGAAVRSLDRAGLAALLADTDAPVVYDGTVVWPEALVSRLGAR
jgi:hypothetical protein